MERKINITADSVEKLNEIKEKLDALPNKVSGQIAAACEDFSTINCTISLGHKDKETVYVPMSEFMSIECGKTGFEIHSKGMRFTAKKTNENQIIDFNFTK